MMGYRSDVGAMFYVTGSDEDRQRARALLTLWWAAQMESCPPTMAGSFEPVDDGYRFFEDSVKWYDSYAAVQWFNALMGRFISELVDNAELDGGSGLHQCFAHEFVRIGEEPEDNVYEYSGHTDNRVQLNRSIDFS